MKRWGLTDGRRESAGFRGTLPGKYERVKSVPAEQCSPISFPRRKTDQGEAPEKGGETSQGTQRRVEIRRTLASEGTKRTTSCENGLPVAR